jgi:lipopolysaccharide export system protein LptC
VSPLPPLAAPPVLPTRPRRSAISRLLDQASIYLPVLLMGLLALGSYWLLRATPEAPQPAVERALTHEPDYFLRRFSVKVFDASGVLSSEVYGVEARHHPDTDTVEIDQARIRRLQTDGPLTTATAQLVRSNGQQTDFELLGDAIVVREGGRKADGAAQPRVEFRGEQLRVRTEPQHITSDQPVTLLRGKDRLKADTLDYRGEESVAVFKGRVRAQLVP